MLKKEYLEPAMEIVRINVEAKTVGTTAGKQSGEQSSFIMKAAHPQRVRRFAVDI